MDNIPIHLTIDLVEHGVLNLVLDRMGEVIDSERVPWEGPVDSILLTAVDNLLRRNTVDKSALSSVTAGPGVDKTSSLYRIVISFGSAVARANSAT